MSNRGTISLVAASAGTGKTWRLCKELSDAVAAGVPPARILATTFTNRAAAELLARGRTRLLEDGRRAEAEALMLARIGTVNGVFGRMVSDHALAQGRSPVASVVPEAAQKRIFRIAADVVIGRHAAVFAGLAARFGFSDGMVARDWRAMLGDVVGAARLNRLDGAALLASADRSWAGLRRALPAPATNAASLDQALRVSVAEALAVLRDGDGVGTTTTAIELLRRLQPDISNGTLAWPEWARLTKVAAPKAFNAVLEPVREAAAQHPRHPRLHADLEEFIRTLFTAAGEAMEESRRYKRRRGLVDFVDQEAEALTLFEEDAAAAAIAGQIDLLLVDEFQDTSPIQLALFLRLARLVPRTLLVGDAKQAIYGFRGADPALVAAIAQTLNERSGQELETLNTNRRSRPALVAFPQQVLGGALASLGIDVGVTAVTAHRQDLPGQAEALMLWRVPGKNGELARAALAARIAGMIDAGAAMPIAPRGEEHTRPLRGGDIAVLLRKNDHAREVADALAAVGLKVALERGGLLDCAECALALAGLRVLADDSDTLALAEIAHLLDGDSDSPPWLNAVLAGDAGAAPLRDLPFARALAEERTKLLRLSPREALDVAIAVLDLPGLLPSWGDVAARHANLGALRELATEYEADCQRERRPGSAAGLAVWLADQETVNRPASPDPDAVQVMTCHRAKGLEWPCVILADLDGDDTPRLFNAPAATAGARGINPDDPLKDRWVRFWPWPYGAQAKDVHLDATALATDEGIAARKAVGEENLRLLYVALTRARDYMVLAPRIMISKGTATLKTGWIDQLPGSPLVLPATGRVVTVNGEALELVVEDLPAGEIATPVPQASWGSVLPQSAPPDYAPRQLRPSGTTGTLPVGYEVVMLGGRLPLTGSADMQRVGEALHGFFAADRPTAVMEWRLACVRRLLATWGVTELTAEDAVRAADRLWVHLAERWPRGRHRREWPLRVTAGGQTLSGRADLVVEHGAGIALYDHKSFPGSQSVWPDLVKAHAPQLADYARALERATQQGVTCRAIHLPIAGAMLYLRPAAAM
jgi:ATP-dependent helicase/nuclease subunit A